jgi:hypothetical protein
MKLPSTPMPLAYLAVTWVALCGGTGQLSAQGSASEPGAIYSVSEIRAAVAASRARLRSILAEYVATTRDPSTRDLQSNGSRCIEAASGCQRFIEIVHFGAGFPPELDPGYSKGYFTGKTLNVFFPSLRYCETQKGNDVVARAWKLRVNFLLECLGWWPPADETNPPKRDHPFFLHEALAENAFTVLPRQEEIDGHSCHVLLRLGVDKVWLDPAIGFAARRRELYAGKPSVLAILYELSDYREAAPGIWIPWSLRRVFYDTRHAAPASTPLIDKDTVCTMLRAEVNQVPLDQFDFAPPPGTLVQNRDTGEMIQVPGGLDFLDDVVGIARARADIYASRFDSRNKGLNRHPWRGYVFLAALFLLTILDAYLLRTVLKRWFHTLRHQTKMLPCTSTDNEPSGGRGLGRSRRPYPGSS